MKKKIIASTLIAASIMGAFFIGKSQAKTEIVTETVKEDIEIIPANYVNTQSDEFLDNYIDMREVCDFDATETGIYIHLANGDYYYWER